MGVEGEERFVNEQGVIEDDYRIEFVQDHLKWVHQAIQEVVMFKPVWIKSLRLHRCGFR